MRIAQVAPPFERVPPVGYGGTERVISTLTEELVRRGHDVTLFASGDSQTSARLVPTFPEAVWHHEPAYSDVTPMWTVVMSKVLREVGEFDLLHSHLDYMGLPLTRQSSVPVLTTLHGRLDLPELQPVYEEFADAPLVSISNSQRGPIPWANFVATVYHGIAVDRFSFNPRPQGYLAFLGRISSEKGLDKAIRIARAARMPLKVGARMPLPYRHDLGARRDREYWETVIKPMLGEDVEMIGEVGGKEKSEFLGNAAALLFPINWPEPFGLVMVEALASGTPVLALRHGSVPELIEDGRTGFVRDSEADLIAAIDRLDDIDRATCRQEAERRFSPAAMATAYERVYADLLMSAATRRIFAMDGAPLEGEPADNRRYAVASSR